MRKTPLILGLIALSAGAALADDYTAAIDANEVVEIATVKAGRGTTSPYQACANLYGDFGGGTVTMKLSTDSGVTKVDMTDYAGAVVTVTDDEALCWTWGFASANNTGSTIFYASMSGATSPDMTIDAFDNQ